MPSRPRLTPVPNQLTAVRRLPPTIVAPYLSPGRYFSLLTNTSESGLEWLGAQLHALPSIEGRMEEP